MSGAARSATARLADTLLRSLGGRTVLLRVPAPAVQGDLGEQLGLAIPQFTDTPLQPCTFRKVRPRASATAIQYELLVSASAVQALAGSLDSMSAGVLFATAAGVLIDSVLYTITSASSSEAFGEVYLYRLNLRGPLDGLV